MSIRKIQFALRILFICNRKIYRLHNTQYEVKNSYRQKRKIAKKLVENNN